MLALQQPTVGFSLLGDFLPFRPFLTQFSPPSYSHFLNIFLNVFNQFFPCLPLILLPIGSHSNILLGILPPSIPATCHSQVILLLFITLTMSAFPTSSFNSGFFLILQIPFLSCTGPKMFLNIFLSNILNCCSFRLVNVQVSHPYVTTGLITVVYIFSFELLFNALDFISAPYYVHVVFYIY